MHAGVTIAALCLAAAGVLFLFAPQEVGAALSPGTRADPLFQLLGAALLGFAAMNWTARGAALGGIYGRAVVVGNLMHLLVGAFVLVSRSASNDTVTPAFLVLTGLYVLGAALFVYLTFFSSGAAANELNGTRFFNASQPSTKRRSRSRNRRNAENSPCPPLLRGRGRSRRRPPLSSA